MPIVILFLLWPLLEIAGFAWIGGMIGVAPTIGFVVLSFFLGLALLRREGLATLLRLRARLEAGETPVPAALDGAWRLLAGLLLVVPGFFSSFLALFLLLPPVRALLTSLVARRLEAGGGVWIVRFGTAGGREAAPTVIDGEFREVPGGQPELPPQH
jgi:UPF0716 protein FxsA